MRKLSNEFEESHQAEMAKMEENRAWLLTTAEKLGYQITPVEKNQNEAADKADRADKSFNQQWTGDWKRSGGRKDVEIYRLEATRADGKQVIFQVVLFPTEESFAFPVDIQSPTEYEGHGGNHDMTRSELESSLKRALEGSEYPKQK
jgi:hypothetical protein